MQFRYDTSGKWFKGNTHIHSTASDGAKTFPELAEMYAGAGYDFLFRTDHWVASDVSADTNGAPVLWMDGLELDGPDDEGAYFHVVCFGKFSGIQAGMGLMAALEAVRAQDAFLVLAHPHWTGNSFEDAIRHGFHGVEVYNHVCRWLNGKCHAAPYWNAMLDHHPNTVSFSVDDIHAREDCPIWNGGWIHVNAPERTQESIDAAIRSGNFYSSCGPEIREITWNQGRVTLKTSPVRYVRLVGAGYLGLPLPILDGKVREESVIEVPEEWPYAYVEIEDAEGRRAWTNTLFVAES